MIKVLSNSIVVMMSLIVMQLHDLTAIVIVMDFVPFVLSFTISFEELRLARFFRSIVPLVVRLKSNFRSIKLRRLC